MVMLFLTLFYLFFNWFDHEGRNLSLYLSVSYSMLKKICNSNRESLFLNEGMAKENHKKAASSRFSREAFQKASFRFVYFIYCSWRGLF